VETFAPEAYFAAAAEPAPDVVEQPVSDPASGAGSAAGVDEEAVLRRIVELEALIADDRARKARHQKPDRQRAWERELEALYRRLN
jgi:ATP-binding cassette, subfamily F, member 3